MNISDIQIMPKGLSELEPGRWGKWQRFFADLKFNQMGKATNLSKAEAQLIQSSIMRCSRRERNKVHYKICVALRKKGECYTLYLWKELLPSNNSSLTIGTTLIGIKQKRINEKI